MVQKLRLTNKMTRHLYKLNVLASDSKMNIKHAAGIIKNGKMIDFCTNSHRTKFKLNNKQYIQCSLHAEIGVIKKLIYNLNKNNKLKCRKLNKYKLIVVRKNYSNSLPCKHCSNIIKQSGISKIFYTNGSPNKCILTNTKTANLISKHQSRAVLVSLKHLTN